MAIDEDKVEPELEVDEAVAERVGEFVKNIKAKQWLLARRYFEEPIQVIMNEEIAMTMFVAYLKGPEKGWKYYEEMTLSELGDVLDKAFAEDDD